MKKIIKLGAVFLLIITAFAGCADERDGGDDIFMLITKAKVIEIYSPKSVLVEVIAEVRNGEESALTERTEENMFLAGEKVQAEFYSDILLLNTLNNGDIIHLLRGNTQGIDFSKEPYVAECYSIEPADNTVPGAESLFELVKGMERKEIHAVLGEPSGMLSGFFGDTYLLENGTSIIVYYNDAETVENIIILNKDGNAVG